MTVLTGKTVTDAMIRMLREDADREGCADLVQMCDSGLRFPTTIMTFADAKQRLAARTGCADEIHRRAHDWRKHGDARPSSWARYAELVQALRPPNVSDTTTSGGSGAAPDDTCQ